MTDREKVMTGLECLITNSVDCSTCPYAVDGFCPELVAKDAMELLKEQEPAKVVDGRPRCRFACGNCGAEFAFVYNYCPSCGRKVDWDE